jgi:hypothetical protein
MVLFEFVPKMGKGQKVLLGGAGRWKRCLKRQRCLGVQQVFSGRVNTTAFAANENGPIFANQNDPTRMAVGLAHPAHNFL